MSQLLNLRKIAISLAIFAVVKERTMKKFLSMSFAVLAVAFIVGVTAGAAKADTVTFTTAARFNGGAFGTGITIGGVMLSFQGISPASTVTTPSNTSLGAIVVSCVGGGTAFGLQ